MDVTKTGKDITDLTENEARNFIEKAYGSEKAESIKSINIKL